MENLVQGNKELTDSMNQVINENWQDIWSEMNEGITAAVSTVMTKVFTDVVNVLSADDFYSE